MVFSFVFRACLLDSDGSSFVYGACFLDIDGFSFVFRVMVAIMWTTTMMTRASMIATRRMTPPFPYLAQKAFSDRPYLFTWSLLFNIATMAEEKIIKAVEVDEPLLARVLTPCPPADREKRAATYHARRLKKRMKNDQAILRAFRMELFHKSEKKRRTREILSQLMRNNVLRHLSRDSKLRQKDHGST